MEVIISIYSQRGWDPYQIQLLYVRLSNPGTAELWFELVSPAASSSPHTNEDFSHFLWGAFSNAENRATMWKIPLLDCTHPCLLVFCCRSIEHVFCLLLSALEWVNLEQMNSCLLFLNAASNDALCMNKGKTWSQVITPRNMFSVSFLKGWNLRVFLTWSLWPNHRIAQSYYSTQPFTKCSGVEQYRIAGLVPDSCST